MKHVPPPPPPDPPYVRARLHPIIMMVGLIAWLVLLCAVVSIIFGGPR